MKDAVGVIHGRFQMLHYGHMEYLLAGKERCERLIIGISNPDVTLVKFNDANPHRSAWMGFAYSVLAGIKKSCLSLCRGKFADALAYLKISLRLLCKSREVLRVRKQIKTKQPNFLAS